MIINLKGDNEMKEKISLSKTEIRYIIQALMRDSIRREKEGDQKAADILDDISSDLAEALDNRQKSIWIER